jgi:glyoxylase-like metal-dependent hydrolase (beta-lactamase superfamily II)
MEIKPVVPGLHQVKLGFVNAFLLEGEDGLTLIDTGVPGSDGPILEAIRSIGRVPSDVRRILVTHCHADHAGGLAALKRETGGAAYMHPDDAEMVRTSRCMRPLRPAPGLIKGLIFRLISNLAPTKIEAAEVEDEVRDGDELPISGGLRAILVPGHCAGQLAFLWPQHGGVLIAADAAANVMGLALSPAYEDLEAGKRSLAKLAALEFEVACFGHGRPIVGGASGRFRREWGPATRRDPAAA